MKTPLLIACRLLLVYLAFVGCKRGVITKGSGDDVPESLAVPGSNGPRVRTALVIGNTHYKHLQRLDACKHDAQVMADTFQKIGIGLYQGNPLFDLSSDEMDAAVGGFARSLDRNSEAFLYYSGHGAQIGGSNYLLPVNFDAQYENQAKRQAISLDSILEILEKTPSKLRIVILDACRDPGDFLPGEALQKGALHAKGLSEQQVDAPETLVCFATKHGTAALADDTSSYYSRILAEEMLKPVRIDDVLRNVARRVYTETEQRQLPFTYGSLLQDHFFVAPRPVATAPPTPALIALAPSTPEPLDLESEIQKRVKAEMAKLAASSTPTGPPVVARASTPPVEMARLTTPAPVAPGSISRGSGGPEQATKEAPFVNLLGMKFVPVPGTKVLFSGWDTRVQDYEVYAREKGITPEKPSFEQGPTHPVVEVSWEDARAFCAWLSQKEGRGYRLPTDAEWSMAVGLGAEQGSTPEEKDKNGPKDVFPWGRQWPPPEGAGNYGASLKVDSYANTSPVGSFAANRHGLYDMGGNVWQWCEDWYNAKQDYRVLRGGSWIDNAEIGPRSSYRLSGHPTYRVGNYGFRCVLVVSGG